MPVQSRFRRPNNRGNGGQVGRILAPAAVADNSGPVTRAECRDGSKKHLFDSHPMVIVGMDGLSANQMLSGKSKYPEME